MKHDPLSNEWMEELMPKALIIGFVAFVFALIGNLTAHFIILYITKEIL